MAQGDAEDMDRLITEAEGQAETGWEIHFVDSMRSKLDEYGERARFTEGQLEKLAEIAAGEGPRFGS